MVSLSLRNTLGFSFQVQATQIRKFHNLCVLFHDSVMLFPFPARLSRLKRLVSTRNRLKSTIFNYETQVYDWLYALRLPVECGATFNSNASQIFAFTIRNDHTTPQELEGVCSLQCSLYVIEPNGNVINNENNESQTSLFHQIRHRSSAFRTITNNNTRRETVDSIVNNIAQQIYIDSFDELRR